MVGQNLMGHGPVAGTPAQTAVQPADVLGDVGPVIEALQQCIAACRSMELPPRPGNTGSADVNTSVTGADDRGIQQSAATPQASASRPSCCLQCAQVCSLAISLLNERSPLAIDAADLCSKACECCATEMSEHTSDPSAEDVVEACRRAAESLHEWRPLSTSQPTSSVEAFGG
jgi:hypothetical protein